MTRGVLSWLLLVLLMLVQLAASFWAMALTMRGIVLVLSPYDAMMHLFANRLTWIYVATASVAALLPGSLAAMAMWRLRVSGPVLGVIAAPLLMPLPVLMFHYDTQSWPVIGLVVSQGLAIGVLCGALRLRHLEPALLRVAASSGWGPVAALRRVVLRQMMPGMFAALVLAIGLQIVNVAALQSLDAATAGNISASIATMQSAFLLAGGLAVGLCLLLAIAIALLRRR